MNNILLDIFNLTTLKTLSLSALNLSGEPVQKKIFLNNKFLCLCIKEMHNQNNQEIYIVFSL